MNSNRCPGMDRSGFATNVQLKIILSVIVFFLWGTGDGYCQLRQLYVSPGLEISWSMGNKIPLTIISKVSLGFIAEYNWFNNITFGFHIPLTLDGGKSGNSYNFIEYETGQFMVDKIMVTYGAGCGAGFLSGRISNIFPKISLFCGDLAFARWDALFIPKKPLISDLGVMGVIPIPIYEPTQSSGDLVPQD